MNKTLHHRACHLCEAICGLTIEITQEPGAEPRINSIKGDPLDSFSRGHICPKAVALQDIRTTLTGCARRTSGQATAGRRLAGTKPSRWPRKKLWTVQQAHGQNAVAVYQGNPSVHNYGLMTHSNYFLGLLKTRNRFSATSVDQLPHHLTSYLMYGHGLLLPIPDIDHTDFMLILGGNPLASNGSIMTVPDVEKRLKAIQARVANWLSSIRGAVKPQPWLTSMCLSGLEQMPRCCAPCSTPCLPKAWSVRRHCRSMVWTKCVWPWRRSLPS